MYADLGSASLYLALILSMMLSFSPFWKVRLRYVQVMWIITFCLCTISFLCLIICFMISDFTVVNVVNNSHITKPLIYKISGAWGNHEGSMLLWVCALSFFSVLFACQQKNFTLCVEYTSSIQALLLTFFISFIIFTSDPFERVFPAPIHGYGLNPILQDIGLSMHPPMLYLGYVGFSLVYSGAIAALIEGRLDKEFAMIFRPYVLLSWSFLTLGVGLGSWWAYRELGWGGFWFWDPVENASLMPWLTATALIHNLIVLHKFQQLKHWNLLLSIMTFTFSMIGTFLVRSNIITSVHSFAQDPKRGIFILIFLGVITGCGLFLYAMRSPRMTSVERSQYYFFSRQTFIILNNIMLSIAAFIIVLGTLYPAILEVFTGQKISVGAPYFNALIAPIAIILLLLMILGIWLQWLGNTKIISIFNTHRVHVYASALITFFIYFMSKVESIIMGCGIFLGIWLILSMTNYLWIRRKTITLGSLSMAFGHIGFGLLVLSIILNAALQREAEQSLKIKESMVFDQFQLTLQDITLTNKENYIVRTAEFKIFKKGTFLVSLFPETRFFPVELQQTTEAAIYHSFLYDLYLTTAQLSEEGVLMVRVYYKPAISYIWLACILMVIGGMIAMIKSFYIKKTSQV